MGFQWRFAGGLSIGDRMVELSGARDGSTGTFFLASSWGIVIHLSRFTYIFLISGMDDHIKHTNL